MRGPITLWFGRSSGAGLAVLLLSATSTVRGERVIYVHATAGGTNNGASWTDAYADLQDALDDAKANGGCPCEIWVAAGIYYPDRGTGDQTLAFELANNIGIYGGFGGWEECREQRDPGANESILNGDLNDDDDPAVEPTSGCCFQHSVCDDAACRDRVIAEKPDCATLWRSSCAGIAVELCCDLCRPTRCDNTFNVVVAIETDATPVLDGVTVEAGEGVLLLEPPALPPSGGLYSEFSRLTVNGCTFRNNTLGMVTISGAPTVTDSSFVHNGNRFSWTGALFINAGVGSQLRVRNCTFVENTGPGIETFGGDAPIEGCKFIRNRSSGLWNYGSRDVIDCTFIDNQYSGVHSATSVRLIGCRFLGNSNPGWGGGVQMGGGNATVINCVFSGNRAMDGGAFAGSGWGVDRFTNCTVVGNSATRWVGGISAHAVKNCILWGNTDDSGSTQHAQLAALRVDYSIIQGWDGSRPGTATTSLDPLLLDPLGPDGIVGTEDDDLRLSPGSPAINAGDPNPSGLPTTDLDGHARVLCGRADIGAYEFGIGDFNCDQQVDMNDFAIWPACMTNPRPSAILPGCEAFDFDADSDVDLSDFAGFLREFEEP